MTDLSNLPPEMREIFEYPWRGADSRVADYMDTLRDYILRVTADNDRMGNEIIESMQIVGTAISGDGKHVGHLPDMCRDLSAEFDEVTAERDALAKRIADAPRALVCAHGWNALTSYNSHDLEPLNGKRVALVEVE